MDGDDEVGCGIARPDRLPRSHVGTVAPGPVRRRAPAVRVTEHLGPQLAARSMSGYLGAADRGDTARASAIGADLRREWLRLEATVTDALSRAEHQLDQLLP